MASVTEKRIITQEESIKEYSFQEPGKEIHITGIDLTDEKVKIVMSAFKQYIITGRQAKRPDILASFSKFQAICKEQKVEVAIR
ncbi:MAG: hypothetical protein K1X28_09520 [Parachlamydiales bacterium]|nr:hypothetical protein [Parachlamydiales bacterium]